MEKELSSLDRFATLNKICSSEDLFIKFYRKHLLNKKLNVWKGEVRRIFKEIASSLRISSAVNDASTAVGYRYKMLLVLQRKINNLKESIDINMDSYRLYRNAPDILFGQEMRADMKELNRSHNEASFVYRRYMERRLSVLLSISPFVDACNSVVNKAEIDFKGEFSIFLAGASDVPKRKFKTEFTVPQLAYFFRVLLQKGVISEEVKKDLFRTIAENFDTNNTKGNLSEKSIKNKFDIPEVAAMNYIAKVFNDLATAAKKEVTEKTK